MYRVPVSLTPEALAAQWQRSAWKVVAIVFAVQLVIAFIWPTVTEKSMGIPCPSNPIATWTKNWRTLEYGWPFDFKVSKYNLCNGTREDTWSAANLVIDSVCYLISAIVGVLIAKLVIRPTVRRVSH
jgi:hypothetical protein